MEDEEDDGERERGYGKYPPGESPFENGSQDRRYGLRNIPMEPDSSEFAVWNVATALFGYIGAYFFCFNGQRSGGRVAQIAPHFVSFIRRVIDDIRILIGIPVRLIIIVWGWITVLWAYFSITYSINIPIIATAIPVPLPVFILLWFILLYVVNAFWPLVYLLVVTIIIPFINVSLLVLSFAFNLIVLTLRIVFTMYNMNVPFLGLELYFLFTLIFTIFEIVFTLIEATGLMAIFQALMEVLFFIVDIHMQMLMVFLELPMGVIQILAEVVSYIMKMVMIPIEYVMEIISWVLDYLFKIMEPILFIVQYIASAFSWMMGSIGGATSRSLLEFSTGMSQRQLLSLGISGLAMTSGGNISPAMSPLGSGIADRDQLSCADSIYMQWAERTPLPGNLTESERAMGMKGVHAFLEEVANIRIDGHDTFKVSKDSFFESRRKQELPVGFGTSFGRKLMESRDFQRSAGGLGPEAPAEKELNGAEVDHTTEVFMRHFHAGVKKMVADPYTNLDLMHRTMATIREHQQRGTDEYAVISIMAAYDSAMGHNKRLPKGPAHLRFVNHPDHPAETHNYFTEVRRDYSDRHSIPYTYKEYEDTVQGRSTNPASRKLLEAWTDVTKLHAAHLNTMEKDHARQIVEQAKTYKDHHTKRIHTISTLGHGLREAIYDGGQTVLHPDVLGAHGEAILKRFGYNSLQDVYLEYKEKHGSPEAFWMSVTDFRSNPFFKSFFHSYDRMNEHEHFRSWMDEFIEEDHLRVVEERPAAEHFTPERLAKVLGENHRLVKGREKGGSERALLFGSNKLEGLQTIATTTCTSSPRNPLCMPDLSGVPFLSPSLIEMPDRIGDESEYCRPWEPTTDVWNTQRLINGWYSLLFLFTALPFINYFFYGFTLIVPWMAWSVNWLFAVIPGGETAAFEDIFCFFVHLYDLFYLFVTYVFFRYVVYPIFDAIIFMPIQRNITSHNQQYEIQAKALEMAENDRRFESMIALQRELLESANRSQAPTYNIVTNNVDNQGPATITFNIGAHDGQTHDMHNFLKNESLTEEEHRRLRRILMVLLGHCDRDGNIVTTSYDEMAADIGRLGLSSRIPSNLLRYEPSKEDQV